MKKFVFTTTLILAAGFLCLAQVGSIQGTIYYEEEAVPGATVKIISGTSYAIESSAIDGRFKLKPLDPGIYSIRIESLGAHPVTINDIVVRPDQITFIKDVNLISSEELIDIDATVYGNDKSKILINPEETSKIPIDRDMIVKLPGSKNPVDLAASLSTEISKDDNNQMIIRGSRPGSSSVYIDGVKMSDESSGVPRLAVGDMEVYTGGVPAKYGDFTGGVVIMRTASYFDMLSEYESRTRRFQELADMEKEMAEKKAKEEKKAQEKEKKNEESEKSSTDKP